MSVEGTLDLFKLPEILQLISQQNKTGILTVQGQQDIVAISFLNGSIVAADALSQTLEEALAQILVKEGVLSAPDLARAVSEHQAAGGRLIDLLVERRYLERRQLLDALRLQTWRLLEQLLRWNEGDFKFYSGDEVSYEEGFKPISVEELLIRNLPSAPPSSPVPKAAPPRPAAPAPMAVPAPKPAPVTGPRPVPVLLQPPSPAPSLQRPESDATGQFRMMKVEPRQAAQIAPAWVGRILAVLLAVLSLVALWRSSGYLMIPFPWQHQEREAMARNQRAALYLKIDHAAKTWFLLKGSFPDRLDELVQAGLLSKADLVDSQGRPLLYTPGEESYTLQPLEGGRPVQGAEATEAISGNYLLDPEFLSMPSQPTTAPLVLLD